jgi:hypothetical protein
VGEKRNKDIMNARHIAVWLSKELCDATYAEIGEHFGGRSHATMLNSIRVVDKKRKEDKIYPRPPGADPRQHHREHVRSKRWEKGVRKPSKSGRTM